MNKITTYIPIVLAVLIIVIVLALLFGGAFDAPKETMITSSTLTEVINTAKLATAKYIQHGIAKAHIEGKADGYILYYAIVETTVDVNEIGYEIDDDQKTVTVVLPESFAIEVELLQDDTHKFYYYPDNKNDWTAKEAHYICETDARQKAAANTELMTKARESLQNTIEALLSPLLSHNGYTLIFEETDAMGGVDDE